MTFYNGLIGLFWLIFIVAWFFSYFGTKKSTTVARKKNIGWQMAILAIVFFIFRGQLFYWLAPYDALVEGNATIHLFGVILCGGGMLSVLWNKWYLRKKWSSRAVFFSIATAIVGSILASSLVWLLALALFYYYFYK
jgi:hypothetical protein